MKVHTLPVFLLLVSLAFGYQQYCRCECNEKSVVQPIERCGLCTKPFCMDHDPKLCDEDASEDILISCYQIESTKDSIVVYLFIIIVCGLVANGLYRLIYN
ncbi:uncharacterized protein PRCAT00004897001 [Priceomyces carsonii]|uniref:uncharacterized protein n=1 Tax=Priceomyces carsonii TaxID=28549 RepID=UPI002ED9DC1D|nr:unnamed protein product [Priceomyces carsonii]